jgi:hypothetical protein
MEKQGGGYSEELKNYYKTIWYHNLKTTLCAVTQIAV